MAPFVMQIGGRDSPDQLAEWRFRIDCIAWIDVALPRSRLRKHSEMNKLRSLAVPREIGTHLAQRHVGKRIGCLTHVRVPRSMPLARAVADYQKHRVKKLKKQGGT